MAKEKPVLEEWQQPTPIRKKYDTLVLGVYLPLSFIIAVVVGVVGGLTDGKEGSLPWLIALIVVFVVMTVVVCALAPKVIKKERDIELERYAYLFDGKTRESEDEVKINMFELTYTLTKNGLRVEWQTDEEQVFDGIQENYQFFRYEEMELLLATQSRFRRVHIALACLPRCEGEDSEFFNAAFFLPMDEKLFAAMEKFGLKERLDTDDGWAYLFYNPKDAFAQILARGRIVKKRDKDTGKIIKEEK